MEIERYDGVKKPTTETDSLSDNDGPLSPFLNQLQEDDFWKELDYRRHETFLFEKGIYVQAASVTVFSIIVFFLSLFVGQTGFDPTMVDTMDTMMMTMNTLTSGLTSPIVVSVYCIFVFGTMIAVVMHYSFGLPPVDDQKIIGNEEDVSGLTAEEEEEEEALGEPPAPTSNPYALIHNTVFHGEGSFASLIFLLLLVFLHLMIVGLQLASLFTEPGVNIISSFAAYRAIFSLLWILDGFCLWSFVMFYNFQFRATDRLFALLVAAAKIVAIIAVALNYTDPMQRGQFTLYVEFANFGAALAILFFLFYRNFSFGYSPYRRQLALGLYSLFLRYTLQALLYFYVFIVTLVRHFVRDVPAGVELFARNLWLGAIMVWIFSAYPSSVAFLSFIRLPKRKITFWKKVVAIFHATVLASLYCGFVAFTTRQKARDANIMRFQETGMTMGSAEIFFFYLAKVSSLLLTPIIFYEFYIGFRSVRTKLTSNNLGDLGLVPDLDPGHTKVVPALMFTLLFLHAISWGIFFIFGNWKTVYFVAVWTGFAVFICWVFLVVVYRQRKKFSPTWFLRFHWLFLVPATVLLAFHVWKNFATAVYLWTLVFTIIIFTILEKAFFTNYFRTHLAESKIVSRYLIFVLKMKNAKRFASSYKAGQQVLCKFRRDYKTEGAASKKVFKESFTQAFTLTNVKKQGMSVICEIHINPELSGTELLIRKTNLFSFKMTRGFWGNFGPFLHRRGPAVMLGSGVSSASLIGVIRTEYRAFINKEDQDALFPFFCVIADRAPYIEYLRESLKEENDLDALVALENDVDQEVFKKQRVILLLTTGSGTNWNQLVRQIHESWCASRSVNKVLACGACVYGVTPLHVQELCKRQGIPHFFKNQIEAKGGGMSPYVLYRGCTTSKEDVRSFLQISSKDTRSAFLFYTPQENREEVVAEAATHCERVFGGNETDEDRRIIHNTIADDNDDPEFRKVIWVLDPSEDHTRHILWVQGIWKKICVVSGSGLKTPPKVDGTLDLARSAWPRATLLHQQ